MPTSGRLESVPVEIDSVDRLLREPVAQNGPVKIGVQRLEIQGRQHGLGGAAEVDGNFVGHVAEANTLGRRWMQQTFE